MRNGNSTNTYIIHSPFIIAFSFLLYVLSFASFLIVLLPVFLLVFIKFELTIKLICTNRSKIVVQSIVVQVVKQVRVKMLLSAHYKLLFVYHVCNCNFNRIFFCSKCAKLDLFFNKHTHTRRNSVQFEESVLCLSPPPDKLRSRPI